MKQYKFLFFLCAITISSCGQFQNYSNIMKDNEKYEIFAHTRIWGDFGEKDIITVNDTLIQLLPQPVKTIISRYSLSLPDYMLDKEQCNKLAKSLGDFPSLKEAQKSLLKKWGSDFEPAREPVYLTVKRTGNVLVFKYGFVYGTDYVLDEFKINKNGEIIYLEPPDLIEKIPYSRKVLSNEYWSYRFILNGEEVDDRYFYSSVYLDGDNIKSVGVNKRDRIVYIEQKNKNPEYFVLSDLSKYWETLDVSKYRKIDEIEEISIYDPAKEWTVTFLDTDKIEKSAIEKVDMQVTNNSKIVITFIIKE